MEGTSALKQLQQFLFDFLREEKKEFSYHSIAGYFTYMNKGHIRVKGSRMSRGFMWNSQFTGSPYLILIFLSENILGINILLGKTLQSSVEEFRLKVQVVKIVLRVKQNGTQLPFLYQEQSKYQA
jgi:hypothetical protein